MTDGRDFENWHNVEEFFGSGLVFLLEENHHLPLGEHEFAFWHTGGGDFEDSELLDEIIVCVGPEVDDREARRRLRAFRRAILNSNEDGRRNERRQSPRTDLPPSFLDWAMTTEIAGRTPSYLISPDQHALVGEHAFHVFGPRPLPDRHFLTEEVLIVLAKRWKPRSLSRALRRFIVAHKNGHVPTNARG
jgi:hypothetical protein